MFGFGKKKSAPAELSKSEAPVAKWQASKPASRSGLSRVYFIVLFALLGGGIGFGAVKGIKRLEARNAQGGVKATVMNVNLIDAKTGEAPALMPEMLRRQIAAAIVPKGVRASDLDLAQKVFESAQNNPWISQVHSAIKKISADPRVICFEVKAQFRQPFVRVKTAAGNFEYVDVQGIRLPQEQVARFQAFVPTPDGKGTVEKLFIRKGDVPAGLKINGIHYITIEGVAAKPPPLGQKWQGDDLADGLKLAAIVSVRQYNGRTYANQISAVDVRNWGGRVSLGDSHLCLRAQIGEGPETIVRFGRFPSPEGDWEIDTDRKMHYLDTFVGMHKGQLTGAAIYVELRGYELRYRPMSS